jgi:hypothetical protein
MDIYGTEDSESLPTNKAHRLPILEAAQSVDGF